MGGRGRMSDMARGRLAWLCIPSPSVEREARDKLGSRGGRGRQPTPLGRPQLHIQVGPTWSQGGLRWPHDCPRWLQERPSGPREVPPQGSENARMIDAPWAAGTSFANSRSLVSAGRAEAQEISAIVPRRPIRSPGRERACVLEHVHWPQNFRSYHTRNHRSLGGPGLPRPLCTAAVAKCTHPTRPIRKSRTLAVEGGPSVRSQRYSRKPSDDPPNVCCRPRALVHQGPAKATQAAYSHRPDLRNDK
eukprot:5440399-Pyramimonas_sp.AAC.4